MGPVTLEVDNGMEVGVTKLNRLRLSKAGRMQWEHILGSEISAVSGSR